MGEESFSKLEFFTNANTSDPRAYKLEYSVEMHKLSEKLRKEIADGKRVVGIDEGLRREMSTPEKLLESLVEGRKRQLGSTDTAESNGIYFYEVPASEGLTK
jgi:hypothetical protein